MHLNPLFRASLGRSTAMPILDSELGPGGRPPGEMMASFCPERPFNHTLAGNGYTASGSGAHNRRAFYVRNARIPPPTATAEKHTNRARARAFAGVPLTNHVDGHPTVIPLIAHARRQTHTRTPNTRTQECVVLRSPTHTRTPGHDDITARSLRMWGCCVFFVRIVLSCVSAAIKSQYLFGRISRCPLRGAYSNVPHIRFFVASFAIEISNVCVC